ncbi:unnamed protein product, partial [Rotaria magnacalcarata]
MNNSMIRIVDIPEEMLLAIFKKLNNIDILYSLVGVNQKLDKVACDIGFTRTIDLTMSSSDEAEYSGTNTILDRFYNSMKMVYLYETTYIISEYKNISSSNTPLKLKSFSLYVRHPTVEFDNQVVPLLRRMVHTETLTLSLFVVRRTSFLDGTYLADSVINHMSRLHTFIFDIVTRGTMTNAEIQPSADDIRRTFVQIGIHVDCYMEYNSHGIGRCHVYSLPFTMTHIHIITYNFPGGMFINVRVLRIIDFVHSFDQAFFARISHAFPLLSHLSLTITAELKEKPSRQLK